MSTPALLGVDGGGSSTIAWLADAAGAVLGRGRSGASNVKAIGPEAARRALERAIRQAFADAGIDPCPVAVACFGLAGFDRPDDKALIESWSLQNEWANRLVLVNDGDLLLAAGTPAGWGIGVISGTGSIAVGKSPNGQTARSGGWGYLFGDEGSAYAVAVAALRWIAQAHDGRLPALAAADLLTRRVCAELGAADPPELISVIYKPEVDRARIAALAPAVVEAAEEHSQPALTILHQAAADLAAPVLAVARALRFLEASTTAQFPLVTAGGFLLATPMLQEALLTRLHALGLSPATVTPVPDPVFGALTLARRALDA